MPERELVVSLALPKDQLLVMHVCPHQELQYSASPAEDVNINSCCKPILLPQN